MRVLMLCVLFAGAEAMSTGAREYIVLIGAIYSGLLCSVAISLWGIGETLRNILAELRKR